MGLKYLWDTNTVIYYLQQQFPAAAESFIDEILQDYNPAISVITEIELLCWKTDSEGDLKILKEFIKEAYVLELDSEIKQLTARIRRINRTKLPDAIIAATAISNNLTLLTRNVKDFKNVKGLSIINPHEKNN